MSFISSTLVHAASFLAFGVATFNPTNFIGGVDFKPDRDITSLAGKVILITGGNTGLGKETVLQLAKHHPSKIFLAARSEKKAKDAIESIKSQVEDDVDITWLPLDLMSLDSIRDAASSFTAQSSRLDCLILNAGVMALPPGNTEMGHEIQFGTNYTGHFLLTKLLLPTLLKTVEEPGADVRVVTVSSIGHNLAPRFSMFLDQDKLSRADTNVRYGASKASNILFAAELARRYPALTSVSIHPGVIYTDLYVSMVQRFGAIGTMAASILKKFGQTIPQGALNELWAAVGAKKGDIVNGAYYVPVGHYKPYNMYANNADMAKALWDWTDAEIKKTE